MIWIVPLVVLLYLVAYRMGHWESWPTQAQWKDLNRRVEGSLIKVDSPLYQEGVDHAKLLKALENPFVIQEYPWGTESTGWLGGWSTAASPYAVAVQKTSDIVEAVKFAKQHQVKLVIKGSGHDYLGRSNAPHSLLVWTHPMRKIEVLDAFVPTGAPAGTPATPAVTAEAGARWGEVYQAVTTKHGRYVQGGGCATVGAAGGFLQGGGFGSFSKKYGLAAASLLEAEVVLASGEIVIANAYQNADLLWALKGGGGSTFGVVSKVTLQTHELPNYFGTLEAKITAKTDEAFHALLDYFVDFYRENLSNEHWGEQVTARPNNTFALSLLFQGLTQEEVEAIWDPFFNWLDPKLYTVDLKRIILVPANKFWDFDFLQANLPHFVTPDPEDNKEMFYWAGNQMEVLAYWFTVQSRWIPRALFEKDSSKKLAETLFQSSRHWEFVLHFNKGLANAAPEALERSRATSINPVALDAAGLLIFSAMQQYVFPHMKNHEPDDKMGKEQIQKVNAAAQLIREITPNSGTYINECDYFEQNWQQDFWGEHYPRLLEIKQKYDPDNFFKCHHSVGSSG